MLLTSSSADDSGRRRQADRGRPQEGLSLSARARSGLQAFAQRWAPLTAVRRFGLTGEALGLAGERIALRTLKRRGWRALGQRLATQDAELDLLMLDGPLLVAIEVKTGRSSWSRLAFEERAPWRPGHRFQHADLERVRRATARIAERLGREFRIDLIELVLFDSEVALYHHINIEAPLTHP